jgi:integrase
MSDVEGVHFVRIARPGKPVRWYVYAWRGKRAPLILKSEGPKRPKLGKAELKAIEQALEDSTAHRDAGLLSGLIRLWRGTGCLDHASPEWKALAPTTRDTWGYELDAIERKWGALPIELWNDPRMIAKVIAWRDSRADTPRAADMGVQVLSELLAFGKLRLIVKLNVAADVPAIYQGADRAEIIWLPEDVQAFAEAAMALNRIEVLDALDLANATGMRRSDLVAVSIDEVGPHAIVRTARKKSRGRRRRAVVPLIPESRHLIEALKARPRLPGVRTLLVNSEGRPWTPGSLTQAFNQVRDFANGGAGIVHPGNAELEEPDRKKHLHDCRGTFVTKLCRIMDPPLTDRQIAELVSWSEHNVGRIRRTYVDDAAVVVALGERISRAL